MKYGVLPELGIGDIHHQAAGFRKLDGCLREAEISNSHFPALDSFVDNEGEWQQWEDRLKDR